ncbi:MAG: polysaccharide biosynthesis/export family protein [Chitinophagaceae bacterium]
MKILINYSCITLLLLQIVACTSVKQLRYFNDLPDSSRIILPPLELEQRIIQKGDRLAISVAGESEEATNYFNNYGGIPTMGGMGGGRQMVQGGQNGGGTELGGYLVDVNGNIEFPKLGAIQVAGKTSQALRLELEQKIKPYLKDPIVNVRFIMLQFSVLGEVRSPGIKTLQPQRTTLLDALASAGDLPRTAKRYDIQIYRDYNGKREVLEVDLRKKDILYNPELFQIKHNDVIIVQPRNINLFSSEANGIIGLTTVLISFATLLIALTR